MGNNNIAASTAMWDNWIRKFWNENNNWNMLNSFPEKRQPNARFELATVRLRSARSTTELIRQITSNRHPHSEMLIVLTILLNEWVADPGFDPGTFGLWAQHANHCASLLVKPKDFPKSISICKNAQQSKGPNGIRTRVGGIKIHSDNPYTMGPRTHKALESQLSKMQIAMWKNGTPC